MVIMMMYDVMKNPYKYDGYDLVKVVIDVCQNIDKDCLYYNSTFTKVCEQLTKLCCDIRFNIIEQHSSNVDIVYMNDFDIENILKELCEKYGYYRIICSVGINDDFNDYWYHIHGDWDSGYYRNIKEMCTFFLSDIFADEYTEHSEEIAKAINYRWDYIDFDYDEYYNNKGD